MEDINKATSLLIMTHNNEELIAHRRGDNSFDLKSKKEYESYINLPISWINKEKTKFVDPFTKKKYLILYCVR